MNANPTLTIAGIWTPDNASDPTTHYGIPIANAFYSAITLPDGKSGLVFNGWAFNGWDNKTFYPVSASILEQNADGTLSVVTSKYLPDATTNGSGSVIVADFNGDGKDDIFLAAHNESPIVGRPSTAYLSNSTGGFTKVTLNDAVTAHGANLAYLNGVPTVFTSGGPGDANPYYQYVGGQFVETKLQISYVGPNGERYPTAGGMSAALADFDGDGQVDIVLGDNNFGPGYSAQPSNTNRIAIYKLTDIIANTGSAEAVLNPYFNGKPQYANVESYLGAGQTHTYRVWTDDFNNDGKVDILAGGSLWSATDNSQNYSMLQMLQNTSSNGAMSFVDKTDTLNKSYNVKTAEVDYSMLMLDVDHSGIKSYLIAGSLSPYSNAVQDNYILLNDGTGAMHVYMHDQFQCVGNNVTSYLASLGLQNAFQSITQPRLLEYLTADGKINLEAEVQVNTSANGNSISQQVFVNVPLQLHPTTDYTDNITINDRNNSKLMRTWAGNDTIYDTGANTSASINGGLGIDKCVYSGNASTYTRTHNADGTTTVKNGSLTDTLTSVERLQFADKKIALDVTKDGNTGKALEFIGAIAYNLISDKAAIGGIQGLFDAGYSMSQLSQAAINAGLIKSLAGSSSNTDLVKLVCKNVLGSTPDAATTDALVAFMDGRAANLSQGDFLAAIANLSVNDTHINLTGLANTGVEYTV